ncbi:MAG: ATP synthase F1 subunit gamma, partial [Acidobacteriota bacterium]
AAAKLRRAQDAILATRPYATELQKVTSNLSGAGTGDYEHPLLSTPEGGEGKTLLAVVTGDKGLCGSFNSNVIRGAENFLKENENVDLLLLGRRGVDYFGRRRTPIRERFTSLFTEVKYDDAQQIGDDVIEAFTQGEYSSVYLIYNQFVSVLTQTLTVEQVLPLSSDLSEGETESSSADAVDYLYEPSPESILDALLPRFVIFQFYKALLESQAAEHGARMTAMDNATKNASELIESLTLVYNRSRQAAITTELIEVVSGANALDG